MTTPADPAPQRLGLPIWGVLAWLVVVSMWLTWTPFTFHPRTFEIQLIPQRQVHDLLGNLVLLFPIGVIVALAAPRRPRIAGALAGAVLSVSLEAGQLFLSDRIVSLSDFVLNTAGAAMGAELGIRLRRRWSASQILWATFSIVFAAILIYAAYAEMVFRRGVRLDDWDPEFGIAQGDEIGGNRTYIGRVSRGLICAGSEPARVCAGPGADLAERRRLTEVAEATQNVRLQAHVISGTDTQTGPTRILTFSRGPYLRNITLAQEGTALVVRIRTPLMGPNGRGFEILVPDAIKLGVPTDVRVEFTRGSVRADIASASGTRSTTVKFGALSGGILLRGPDAVTAQEMRRVRAVEAVILLGALLVVVTGVAVRLFAQGRTDSLPDRAGDAG